MAAAKRCLRGIIQKSEKSNNRHSKTDQTLLEQIDKDFERTYNALVKARDSRRVGLVRKQDSTGKRNETRWEKTTQPAKKKEKVANIDLSKDELFGMEKTKLVQYLESRNTHALERIHQIVEGTLGHKAKKHEKIAKITSIIVARQNLKSFASTKPSSSSAAPSVLNRDEQLPVAVVTNKHLGLASELKGQTEESDDEIVFVQER